MVLLHGWGGDQNSLRSIAERISGHRQTLCIALPGFGDSPEPEKAWGTWDYVETIYLWLINRFPNEPVDLIAHSFGGRIAIGLASRHPALVKRVILIGSAGLRPKRSLKIRIKRFWSRQLHRLARLVGGSFSSKMESIRQFLGSEDWRRASPLMRGTMSKVLDEDLSSDLKSIRAPTMLIWGKNDTATPLWMGKVMELLIPGARLTVIEKAGHYCFLDKPGDTVAAIWKHLELPKVW